MFISIEDYALRFDKYRLIHYHMSKALNHHRNIAIDAIERGYPINKYDDVGHTLLWQAVVNNGLDIVELLLKNGADPNMKSRQHGDETGTLFHHIVLIGHRRSWLEIPDIKERFELLLKYGANPNLKNARGNNVITHIKYYMRLWSKKNVLVFTDSKTIIKMQNIHNGEIVKFVDSLHFKLSESEQNTV